MRFNIIHSRTDTVIGETDQIEVALAVLSGDEHLQFTIVDRWSGVALDRPSVPTRHSLVSDDNPYGLPLQYIRYELMRPSEGRTTKIPMIKLVRELTGLGLGEAKQIVDNIDTEEMRRARAVDLRRDTW